MHKSQARPGRVGTAGNGRVSVRDDRAGAAGALCQVDEKLLRSRRLARRSALGCAHLDVLDAYSSWLSEQFPDGATFVTLTYSDENGAKRSAYTPRSCFRDAHRWRNDLKLPRPFLFAAEPHRWRDFLHLHGLVAPMDEAQMRLAAAYWESDRGFARLLPANAGAFPYVTKYSFKNTGPSSRHECLDLSGLRISETLSGAPRLAAPEEDSNSQVLLALGESEGRVSEPRQGVRGLADATRLPLPAQGISSAELPADLLAWADLMLPGGEA